MLKAHSAKRKLQSRSCVGRGIHLFDTYIAVDWSANSTPKTGKDSIWIAVARGAQSPETCNVPTRHQAMLHLAALTRKELAAARSVLAGFDFSFGFPGGTTKSLRRSGLPWRRWWKTLSDLIEDRPDNSNNRFAVASELNSLITRSAAPFWGCPARHVTKYLRNRKPVLVAPEYRLTELRTARAHSIWKLYTAGAVGSQSLLGIPRIESLRSMPEFHKQIRLWPFETGFRPPGNGPKVWFSEIYPSLLDIPNEPGRVQDELQVRTVAAELARADLTGELATWLSGPTDLSASEKKLATTEEGWILGVR